MKYRNEWEIRIFGLRRSGHHAIGVWIAHHFPDRSVHFLNDVKPGLDPYIAHRDTCATTSRFTCYLDRPESSIAEERYTAKHCLMYNYEDIPLANIVGTVLVPDRMDTVGLSEKMRTVLVLRDPYNLMASRLKYVPNVNDNWIRKALDCWMSHAREFLGMTNYLGPKLLVNFNRWFSEEPYRRALAKQAGLAFTDAGLNRVSRHGGGSSFDGIHLDRRAQDMQVLQRWQEFQDDGRFHALFSGRHDVAELSEAIFGRLPGIGSLYGRAAIRGNRFCVILRKPSLLRNTKIHRMGS